MKTDIRDISLDLFKYLEKSDSNFFFLGDTDTGDFRWSENAKTVFSLPVDNSDTSSWQDLIHPSDLDDFLDACQDIQRRHTRQFCGEYRFHLKSGNYAWVQCTGRIIVSEDGEKTLFSGLFHLLYTKNNIDPVTNLRYIGSFRTALTELTQCPVPKGVLLIGIDDFKRINDLYTYSFGDQVLASLALCLEALIPEHAQLYRLDGDCFGILYPDADITKLVSLFDQIQEMVQKPTKIQGVTVSLSVSGGICRYPEDGTAADDIYRNARIAFAESKSRGKKQVTVCTPSLCSQAKRRMRLLDTMRESVRNDCKGFNLRYQPLIHADSETLYGCEILMRWSHHEFPDGVSPYEFIPILEDSGLIFEVNKWLLKESFTQAAKWVKLIPDFQINVNFSCAQFEEEDFRFYVMDMLAQTGLKPSSVTLELTESGAVSDMEVIGKVFSFLRSQGIKIALDDFGIGYSSLSIFQMLKADELKIDRSFLSRLTYDVTDQALVRQLIELCHGINMMVCVEGIESTQVMEIVREFGPELLQGFYYDKPLTAPEFETRYILPLHALIQSGDLPESTADRRESMVYSALRPTQPIALGELVNYAHAGIFQVAMDANFSFITCNEGYRRMLGYTAQDIERKFSNFALGIVYPEDMEYVNQEIRRQLGEGDTVTVEFRVVRSDGTPIWILGTGNVIKGPDGTVSLAVIIIDNHRIKSEHLAMEKKCRRFEQILTNIPVGVKCVQHNEDFTLDYMSPAFLSLLGYEEKDLGEIFDRKYINMVLDEDRPTVLSDVLEQLQYGNIVTLRYRSPRKDGHPIWVETISRLCPPEADGIQRWYSSVVNITDSITEEQKKNTRSFANRIQIAAEQWGDILFEYDFAANQLTFSENYSSLFGRKPEKDMLAESRFVHEEDRYLLEDAVQFLHRGIQPDPIEVRYYSEKRGFFWVSFIFTPPRILGGKPVSVLGRITDTDNVKKERDELFLQSRLDSLTGLLNKKNIEEGIRSLIATHKDTSGRYALTILDIDDFKGINDQYGHLLGDRVLTQTAKRLIELTPESALVGRAGGDEFMLFIKLGNEFQTPDQIGTTLMEGLSSPIEFDGKKVQAFFSAGISVFPTDDTDFYGLYRVADSALYRAKADGKNTYRVSAGKG